MAIFETSVVNSFFLTLRWGIAQQLERHPFAIFFLAPSMEKTLSVYWKFCPRRVEA